MTVRIGSYILGRNIGRGGNAAVYVARQTTSLGTTRLVALKILERRDLDASTFRREAELAMRLEHPAIIRTYDVGEHDGQRYLAMELVVGATLAKARSALALPIFVRLVGDVARALQYAHDLKNPDGTPLGMVHQDITPENVIVGYDGRVRLLDFGVARLSSVDGSRTDTVRGKPAYLSPEQLEGENIDRRTDVFALGALAHELLTGKPLFLRDSVAATYRAILLEPIADLRTTRPDVPEAIVTVIERALVRDKTARWSTAADFATALETMSRVASADDATLARWIAEAVPPSVTVAELEAEIGSEQPPAAPEPAPTLAAPRVHAADEPAPTLAAPPGGATRSGAPAPTPRTVDEERITLPVTPYRRWLAGAAVLAFAALALLVLWPPAGRGTTADPRRAEKTAPPNASVDSGATPIATAPIVSANTGEIPPAGSPPAHASIRARPPATVVSPTVSAPPPSVATATAEPPHGGFLNVWSNVWGHVEVDGRAVGDSPLNHVPLASGSHQLTIRTERGEQTRTVVVAPDEDARARFTF